MASKVWRDGQDAMRLKELEKENAELKKMYAETILDKRINPFRTTTRN